MSDREVLLLARQDSQWPSGPMPDPGKTRVLFLTIAPPENDCGVRVVMYRHLVERKPFEVLVATNADYPGMTEPGVRLRLPYPLHRLRRSRFGPRLRRWLADFENLVWPHLPNRALDEAVRRFRPDAVLTLADNHLGQMALRAARRHGLPLAGLFLDWVPVMDGYFGHRWTRRALGRRFRRLYAQCDLAFCTSDGMQEVLGPHSNCHVIYPMPGRHRIPERSSPPPNGKFRLAYVGSVERFYGRMLCSLIEGLEGQADAEVIVVGPNADWPRAILDRTMVNGTYLGFRPPGQAASVLAGADALLVVMSFEPEHKLFMRTSFTTKFLDYVAFGKPVVLWGPEYCTPVRLVRRHGGALVVDRPEAEGAVDACRRLTADAALREALSAQARRLHETLFNPDRLQGVFVGELERLVAQDRGRRRGGGERSLTGAACEGHTA